MATDQSSCPICIEPYKGRRTKKVCQYCPDHACSKCHERYLLQTYEDPHCMHCKKPWSHEFMVSTFTKTFLAGPLRLWRRKVLMEREKAVLPAMQPFVEYKREAQRAYQACTEIGKEIGYHISVNEHSQISLEDLPLYAQYDRLAKEHRGIKNTILALKGDIHVENGKEVKDTILINLLLQQLNHLKAKLSNVAAAFISVKTKMNELLEKRTNYNDLFMQYTGLYNGTLRTDQVQFAAGGAARVKNEFIMKCPEEGCRGFLSTAYRCGVCEKSTCPSCLVVLSGGGEEAHVCNPEAVESAKMIKAETKPCPKCGTRIFKVDGCDMMWCVVEGCNTAFSWNTGKIEMGRIHNPHYYEWLRRTNGGVAPREAGDVPCGGTPPIVTLIRKMLDMGIPFLIANHLYDIHRSVVDIEEVRLRVYSIQPPAATMNKDIDVQYLMNQLSEEEWQKKLEYSESRYRRKREIGLILHTLVLSAGEIFREVIDSRMDTARMVVFLEKDVLDRLERLRLYGNEALLTLAKRDRMAVPQLGEGWVWNACRALYKEEKEVEAPAAGGTAAATAAAATV